MRTTVKAILGSVVVVVAACVLIPVLMTGESETPEQEAVPEKAYPKATVWEQSDWPMFHGGQGLLGRAAATSQYT